MALNEEIKEIESVASDIEQKLIHSDNLKHLLLLAFLLLLAYLSHIGVLTSIVHYTINDHVFTVDRNYLDHAQATAEKTLSVISGIKSMLALIQSSSGGISFIVDVNVQLGQLFSGISDLVTMSWKISLASLISIKIQGYLLDLSTVSMAPLLTIFFVLLGVSTGISRRFAEAGKFVSSLSLTGLMLVFVAHIILPLSIYITASISNYYFSSISAAVHQSYETISDNLSKHNPNDSLHNQVKNTITSFTHGQKNIRGDSTSYARSTVFHTIFSILEYVITPLLLFVSLYLLIKQILIRVWKP